MTDKYYGLRRRPTFDEMLKEAMTHSLKVEIIPERQVIDLSINNIGFDNFDLSKYDRRLLFNEYDTLDCLFDGLVDDESHKVKIIVEADLRVRFHHFNYHDDDRFVTISYRFLSSDVVLLKRAKRANSFKWKKCRPPAQQ